MGKRKMTPPARMNPNKDPAAQPRQKFYRVYAVRNGGQIVNSSDVYSESIPARNRKDAVAQFYLRYRNHSDFSAVIAQTEDKEEPSRKRIFGSAHGLDPLVGEVQKEKDS